jgi:hypothetical protein
MTGGAYMGRIQGIGQRRSNSGRFTNPVSVRGLVGHLARDAAQLGDVVQHHHRTGDSAALSAAHRRCRQFNGSFAASVARQQKGPPADADGGGPAVRVPPDGAAACGQSVIQCYYSSIVRPVRVLASLASRVAAGFA